MSWWPVKMAVLRPLWSWHVFVWNRCPHCHSQLAWGQWNDGQHYARPFCLDDKCGATEGDDR